MAEIQHRGDKIKPETFIFRRSRHQTAVSHPKSEEITREKNYNNFIVQWHCLMSFDQLIRPSKKFLVSPQLSSELTSEYLFDLTTSVAVPVPIRFACAVFCTRWGTRMPTDGSSDNTFVGQNSPFFFLFSLLLSFFLLIIFNFGHRYE